VDPARWVRGYVDHLEDAAYVRDLFASEGVAGASRALVAMLRSGDSHEAQAAALFIRDVVNYGMAPPFTEHLPRSGLIEALRANLDAPGYAIRRASIYTIGKIGPRANARLLAEAFPTYRHRDPLLLPGLLFELFWLTRRARQWAYLHAVATSPHYLVRWSLLDESASPLPGLGEHDRYERRRLGRLLSRLAGDPHPLVRADAEYRRRVLPSRREERQWRLGDRRALWRRLGHGEPELTFTTLHLLFGNYLAVTERKDYDLGTLEAFVRYRQEHPIPRPPPAAEEARGGARFDMPAYVRAFDAWRQATGLPAIGA
jgi:hypothetical protein